MKTAKRATSSRTPGKPALLSGGNPQIAKADGDAPVQAYIAAMPGWKRDVKVTFFNGSALRPVPPGPSKHKDVRYLDVRESDGLDEKQMAAWVKQAASLSGWSGGSETSKPKAKAKPAPKPAAAARGDWRQTTLARVRELILSADPEITEERKWKKPSNPAGVPVWSRDGIICTGETYRNAVKLTFASGADVPDPSRLFNASLEGNMRRAIDIHEGETIDARAFKTLVKAAVARTRKRAKR